MTPQQRPTAQPGAPTAPPPPSTERPDPFLVRNRRTGTGRFWSVRRLPAALLAAVVLGGAGVLLYDIAAVRAGRPAMEWRRVAVAQLARRRLDEPWVLTGAAVLAAVGLWLIVLAVTPGLRRLLTMRRDGGPVRAGLERTAAALVLRDRAMEVPGVRSVRVRVGRSRARVRALAHFRDLDEVRADLDSALDAAVAELGLVKELSRSVRVSRPPVRKT
ncbi:DUF6286 domain-containing protein [Streptomyces clavuligerus]|uniref:DUF6286 domain-containing protein n=1 Tax=Streptomyces clavuligerus TaxID=1901 RepID=E2PXK5_STRCL|nr:DUF6286 domain-containing protein [Streptomyces clavuligerus]ANW20831.1 hypothetical protein BB341_22765 [Streptomyces clavuligerus]AXU15457.1 hypothetical protein D1794_23665 [Streptomyces clavuligerus]EFG06127.1 Hypothetical protein SCLAV_1049 [Streptomyces clavuligerus]MBY6305552.1 hypothetical protein [Streptomyces clavuligerus]QCS08233.1 hypothetical protein CRV15_23030 [Streptomyces clavuligerus]